MITSLLSRRWFIALTVTLVLFAALLIGTPFLIKHLARQWLLENGGSEVQFRDVDFNPFSGTLLLKDLDVKVDQKTTLSFASAGLDLAWLPLFHKQIKVQSLGLVGFRMVVDNHDMLRIGGIRLPEASPETESDTQETGASGWLSGIESLTLRDFEIVYRDPNIETTLMLDRLLLSDLAQWSPDQSAQLELAGSINGAPIELNAALAPLAESADYRGTVEVRDLDLGGFAGLAKAQLEELDGVATLESEFSVQLEQGNLTDLKLVSDAAQIDNGRLDWKADLDLTQSPDTLDISHRGELALEQIRLISDALQLDGQTGNFKGELSLTQSSDSLRVSHRGGLAFEQLKLVSEAGIIDNQSTRWDGTTAVQRVGADPLLKLETEGALVVAAAELGLVKAELDSRWPRVGEVPFTSERKRMTTVHRVGVTADQTDAPWRRGAYVAFAKCAVDSLLAISTRVWTCDEDCRVTSTAGALASELFGVWWLDAGALGIVGIPDPDRLVVPVFVRVDRGRTAVRSRPQRIRLLPRPEHGTTALEV
mgnify:CR=1 FL=1